MKKFFLTTVVGFSFLIYVFSQRQQLPMTVGSINGNSRKSDLSVNSLTLNNETAKVKPKNNSTPTSLYKDGTYLGSSFSAYYGNVQVQAVITKGQLSDVRFVDFPQDRRTSQRINQQATSILASEAIQAQSAQVDVVSGATDTSLAFQQSLNTALAQAQN